MKVLFVCEGNMMRSQIAEAFYNTLTGTSDATSAGVKAVLRDQPSRRAQVVMDEIGISLDGQYGKQLTGDMIAAVDKVVLFQTSQVPDYLAVSDPCEYWDVADLGYGMEDSLPFDCQVRDDIKQRVEKLIQSVQEEMTITAYDENATTWHDKHKNPNYWGETLDAFQKLLPSGTLLEIGAGGGRDAKDLIARGYDYYGTEPAKRFVEIARAYNPGARFEQKSVYDLEPGEYDGFWASAVLLHVPRGRIQEALGKLSASVRTGAIGFISIKEGDGERVETGGDDVAIERLFVLWRDEAFRVELQKAGFEVVKYIRTERSARTTWLQYIVRVV